MKHLKSYKIFEDNAIEIGATVMILFKLPGTDDRELVPVKIEKKENGTNSYLVSFQTENNPFPNHPNMVIKASKIIGPYTAIREPMSPALTGSQPTPTDYNKAGNMGGGGVSNDVVLPNS